VASSSGADSGLLWPARKAGIFAIYSADGHGNMSSFSPAPNRNHESSFSTLGEDIRLGDSQSLESPLSGTAMAAVIAAAIAANMLIHVETSYAREELGGLTRHHVEKMYNHDGMKILLKLMSSKRDDIPYLAPWLLWTRGSDPKMVNERILKALKDY
jgi:hypothetical protein